MKRSFAFGALRSARLAAFLTCSLFGLNACRHGEIKLPSDSLYRTLGREDAAAVRSKIAERSKLPAAFRVTYEFHVENRIEKQILRQAVVFEAPESLRIDTFASSFQKLLNLVIAKDGTFLALDNDRKILYEGQSSQENIALLTHLPLNVSEYAAWALGLPFLSLLPEDSIEESLSQKRSSSTEFSSVEKSASGRVVKTFLSLPAEPGTAPQVRFLELKSLQGNGKEEVLRIEYRFQDRDSESKENAEKSSDGKTGNSCPAEVPNEIRFSSSSLGIWGKLICQQFERNPDLSEIRERLFRLRVPDQGGIEVRRLD